MSKRVILSIISALLLITTAHAANVTLTPASIYETTNALLALDVNNHRGNSLVTSVEVTSNLPITGAENYSGWTTTQDTNSAEWNSGVLGTNVRSALFEFTLTAPQVSSNTNQTLTATINSQTTQLTLTILDDTTPPVATNLSPNGYIQASMQNVTATITDDQTGVQSATYTMNNCQGGINTTVTLTKNGNTFSGQVNFSSYSEGNRACYTLTATNNAGEKLNQNGELIVDGTPPAVSLTSPNGFTPELTEFTFTASDNLASNLTCQLTLGSSVLETLTLQNNTQTTVGKNLTSFTQGQYLWGLTCLDGVGLSTTQLQQIILDTQAPTITLNALSIRRTRTTSFSAQITDAIGLNTVNASFEGVQVTLNQNGNTYTGNLQSNTLGAKTLTLTAQDNAGHVTTKDVMVTVVPNHELELYLSPNPTTPGQTVTLSGTLDADGTSTATTVLVKTPTGNKTANLTNGTYSTTFTAPAVGNHTIISEVTENGYTYSAQQSLIVLTQSQISNSKFPISHGPGFSTLGNKGTSTAAAPEQPAEQPSDAPAPAEQEETQSQPAPKTEYTPLQPEEPRNALTPQATGVFALGKQLNWLAPLFALTLLAGLGAYAYGKRPPKQESKTVDWDDYFNE